MATTQFRAHADKHPSFGGDNPGVDNDLRVLSSTLTTISHDDLLKVVELGFFDKYDLVGMLDQMDQAFNDKEDGWAEDYERFTRMIQKLIS